MRSKIYNFYKESKNQSMEEDFHYLKKMNYDRLLNFYEDSKIPIKNPIEHIGMNVIKKKMGFLRFKQINFYWVLSSNEILLNSCLKQESVENLCYSRWKGDNISHYFFFLKEYSLIRELTLNNDPCVAIFESILKSLQV